MATKATVESEIYEIEMEKQGPQINDRLSDSPLLEFYTTSDSNHAKQLMAYFYGEDISVSTIII